MCTQSFHATTTSSSRNSQVANTALPPTTPLTAPLNRPRPLPSPFDQTTSALQRPLLPSVGLLTVRYSSDMSLSTHHLFPKKCTSQVTRASFLTSRFHFSECRTDITHNISAAHLHKQLLASPDPATFPHFSAFTWCGAPWPYCLGTKPFFGSTRNYLDIL